MLVVPVGERLTGELTESLVLDAGTGRLRYTVPGLFRPQVIDLDGDGRPELIGPVSGGAAEPVPSWAGLAGWAPSLVPFVDEEGEGEDPRRFVPLPWSRPDTTLGSCLHFLQRIPQKLWQNMRIARAWLLVMIPCMLFCHFATRHYLKKVRRRQGGEQDLQRHRPLELRLLRGACCTRLGFLLLALSSLLTVLLAATIWVALARTELAPGETYLWDAWWVQLWVVAGVVLSTVVDLCFSVYALRLAVRRGRRWLRRSAGA